MSVNKSKALKFGKIVISTTSVDNEKNTCNDIDTDSHNDNITDQVDNKDCSQNCTENKTSTDESQSKLWYKENKLKHRNYMRQFVHCKHCGEAIRRLNITNHKKTAKCLNRREELENTKQITLEELQEYLKLIHDKLIILPNNNESIKDTKKCKPKKNQNQDNNIDNINNINDVNKVSDLDVVDNDSQEPDT